MKTLRAVSRDSATGRANSTSPRCRSRNESRASWRNSVDRIARTRLLRNFFADVERVVGAAGIHAAAERLHQYVAGAIAADMDAAAGTVDLLHFSHGQFFHAVHSCSKDKVEIPKDRGPGRPRCAAGKQPPVTSRGARGASGRHFVLRRSSCHESGAEMFSNLLNCMLSDATQAGDKHAVSVCGRAGSCRLRNRATFVTLSVPHPSTTFIAEGTWRASAESGSLMTTLGDGNEDHRFNNSGNRGNRGL